MKNQQSNPEPILTECSHSCKCHFCDGAIKKGDKFCYIYKNAAKWGVRVNICKDCIRKMFEELQLN